MRALAALLVVSMAAGCAGPLVPRGEGPRVKPPIGPQVTIDVPQNGSRAARFMELVSARCLLDGVLGGAAMVVDNQSGRIVIAGDREQLLAIDILGSGWRSTNVRLSGPAIADPRTRDAVLYHINRAQRTGDTACPILAA